MKKKGAALELNTFATLASASSLPQSLSSLVDLDVEATVQGEANVKGKEKGKHEDALGDGGDKLEATLCQYHACSDPKKVASQWCNKCKTHVCEGCLDLLHMDLGGRTPHSVVGFSNANVVIPDTTLNSANAKGKVEGKKITKTVKKSPPVIIGTATSGQHLDEMALGFKYIDGVLSAEQIAFLKVYFSRTQATDMYNGNRKVVEILADTEGLEEIVKVLQSQIKLSLPHYYPGEILPKVRLIQLIKSEKGAVNQIPHMDTLVPIAVLGCLLEGTDLTHIYPVKYIDISNPSDDLLLKYGFTLETWYEMLFQNYGEYNKLSPNDEWHWHSNSIEEQQMFRAMLMNMGICVESTKVDDKFLSEADLCKTNNRCKTKGTSKAGDGIIFWGNVLHGGPASTEDRLFLYVAFESVEGGKGDSTLSKLECATEPIYFDYLIQKAAQSIKDSLNESLTLIPVGPSDEDLTSEDRAETNGNDDEEDDEDVKDHEDEEDEMDDSDEDSTKRIDWMVEWLDSIIFNWNRMGKSIGMTLGDLLSLLYKPTRNIISIIVDICVHDFVSTQHCSFFVAHDKEDIQNNSIQTFFERKDGKMLVYIGVTDSMRTLILTP